MKMKKIVSLLMVSALSLSILAGCGSTPADNTQADNSSQSTASQTEETAKTEEPAKEETTEGEEAATDGKSYEGVELTMWSMWTSSEPQAQVVQEAADAFGEQTAPRLPSNGRDVTSTRFCPHPWRPATSLISSKTIISVLPMFTEIILMT